MIQILQDNDFFIVLLKPAGVSVHNEKPSLIEFLQEQKLPLHFVNRLDRETSGLMVVAKTAALHASLADALNQGEKTYRALLRSPWKASTDKAKWSWPLTDKAEGWKNPQGLSSERVACESQALIVRTNTYFTEALVTLLTGRQHQIRKHAALAKHPIVGDNRYNEKKYNVMIQGHYKEERMWLHAERLTFTFQKTDYAFENKLNLDLFFTKI